MVVPARVDRDQGGIWALTAEGPTVLWVPSSMGVAQDTCGSHSRLEAESG